MSNRARPVGAILAGGSGRRLGGSKASVRLNGRPLISYALESVWRGLGNTVVVVKADTELPPLPGVPVWIEPEEPSHPITGLVHALQTAGGRTVLVCAGDLPLVTPELIRDLSGAGEPNSVVVARAGERIQPLLGSYPPDSLPALAAALEQPPRRMTDVVAELDPVFYDVPDPALLFNVNTPQDVLEASALLRERRGQDRRLDQPNVKS